MAVSPVIVGCTKKEIQICPKFINLKPNPSHLLVLELSGHIRSSLCAIPRKKRYEIFVACLYFSSGFVEFSCGLFLFCVFYYFTSDKIHVQGLKKMGFFWVSEQFLITSRTPQRCPIQLFFSSIIFFTKFLKKLSSNCSKPSRISVHVLRILCSFLL